MRVGDVVPAAVRLPTLGDNLHKSAAERSFGDVRDAIAVGLNVQFELFVLLDDMLFDVFDVDACVFNGNGFFATGDLDRQAVGLRGRSGRLRGRRRGILSGDANGGRCEKNQYETWKFWPRKVHVPLDPSSTEIRYCVKLLCSGLRCKYAPECCSNEGAERRRNDVFQGTRGCSGF